jgi:hypothetical protein
MALRDRVAAKNDRTTVTIQVPQWDNEPVLFKGLTYDESFALGDVLEAADGDKISDQTIVMIQKTAYDPETNELAFDDDEGAAILRSRGSAAILYMVQNGTNVVLGVDGTAGKDSSSTDTENQTPDA